MNYQEIQKCFQDEKGMQSLLQKYQSVFDSVEDYRERFCSGVIDSPSETDSAMKTLTGLFISLNLVAAVADTVKRNAELQFFMTKKMELEGDGSKIVVASIEKEASSNVSTLRRIRNIFVAYRDSCEKAISICQTSLKSWDRERTVKHE